MFKHTVVGESDVLGALTKLRNVAVGSKLNRPLEKGAEELRRAIVAEIEKQGLVESGDLKRSVKVRILGFEIEVFSDLEYSAIHEFGGTITAKNAPALMFRTSDGRFATVDSVYIPARPYFRPGIENGKALLIAIVSEAIATIIEGMF